MRRSHPGERGSALLVAMAVSAVMLLLIAALFTFVGAERQRATATVRELNRKGCAEAGLLFARSYYSGKVASWNTFLAAPGTYNPVPSSWNTAPVDPTLTANQTAHPELYFDLDGDTKPDVFISIRDNADEFAPAINDWSHDNDTNVILGATCISTTMAPRHSDGSLDTGQMMIESLFSYNQAGNGYTGQSGGGASSSGNIN